MTRAEASTAARVDEAAQLLVDVPSAGPLLEGLSEAVRPTSRAEAYDVQARVAALRQQQTIGWKIAATSVAGQRHINVPGPLAGRLLDDRLVRDPSAIPLAGNTMCLAEVEFVFVLGETLAPRRVLYTRSEVRAAVRTLHLGIELPGTRFQDPTAVGDLQLIADNACSHEFLLGPEASPAWQRMSLDRCTVTAVADGPSGRRQVEGSGANVLGHPVEALTWLVNELSMHGVPLEAGQLVTTGTCCTPIPIEPGDTLAVSYADLGFVTCSFTA